MVRCATAIFSVHLDDFFIEIDSFFVTFDIWFNWFGVHFDVFFVENDSFFVALESFFDWFGAHFIGWFTENDAFCITVIQFSINLGRVSTLSSQKISEKHAFRHSPGAIFNHAGIRSNVFFIENGTFRVTCCTFLIGLGSISTDFSMQMTHFILFLTRFC